VQDCLILCIVFARDTIAIATYMRARMPCHHRQDNHHQYGLNVGPTYPHMTQHLPNMGQDEADRGKTAPTCSANHPPPSPLGQSYINFLHCSSAFRHPFCLDRVKSNVFSSSSLQSSISKLDQLDKPSNHHCLNMYMDMT
jgi:hypothetical protein